MALMKTDKGRLMILFYRDMTLYDLPDGLAMFRSQNMGKINFAFCVV